jgi:hypothetical protein
MSYKLLMLFSGWWLVGTFVGAIGEQIWLATDDVNVVNALLGFKVDQVATGAGGGFFGMMRVGVAFLTTAVPRMALFDYQFLGGDWVVVRFLMVTMFGGPLIFIAAREFITAIQGVWRR